MFIAYVGQIDLDSNLESDAFARKPAMTTTAITLEDRIDSAIGRAPHLLDQVVRIETHAGHVVLRGTVRSYYQKQMAQEAVWTVDGVAQVENQLEVYLPSLA